MSKKILVLRYIFWALTLAIMAVIFFHSAQNATASSDISTSFTMMFLKAVSAKFRALDPDAQIAFAEGIQFFVRKGAHFTAYFALGVTSFSAFCTYGLKRYIKHLLAFLLCVAYAISDEAHQLFVPGRAGQVRDVLIDSSGAVTGILLTSFIIFIYEAIQSKKHSEGKRKMNKKKLLDKLGELVITVNTLEGQLKSAKAENVELKAELELLLKEKAETHVKTEEKPTEEIEISPETEPVTIILENPTLKDENMEYGSLVIGKIVVESARFADKITASDADNKKELLNLIMGKSEVAKAEILSVASSDATGEIKKQLIDAQLVETTDYFKSVAGQI